MLPSSAKISSKVTWAFAGYWASLKATNVEFVFSAKDPGSVSSLN